MLLGPPYKVPKDSTLQSDEVLNALHLGDAEDNPIQEDTDAPRNILCSTERSGARRLFLFSKQSLSQQAPESPVCHLEPMELQIPKEAPGPSPLNLDPTMSPPLHQALAAYERQFMLYLSQGRVLADGADLRLSACINCVQEQAVVARALRAAVSNLSDHYHAASRTRAEFTTAFQSKSNAHGSLLQRFESILQNLDSIRLHPSLISTARSSGRSIESLLDTVPVERERAWAQQCQTSHQRLITLFGDLDTGFRDLGTPASRAEENQQDREAEEEIQHLWLEVDGKAKGIRNRQASRLDGLTTSYREVVKVIMNAINAGDDDDVQAAFTPLRAMSDVSKSIVPSMITDDEAMKMLMEKVAESKTRTMKRMKVRLRDVSVSQSLIQRVLSSVGVLRDALSQQVENMVHLEHVAELPDSYRDFLSEIRRRRAYGQAVTSSCAAMMEKVASIRANEVKAREKFLRGSARHLMPAFFEVFAPTLATPPPLFTPQLPPMLELDTLPDVGYDTEDPDTLMQKRSGVNEQGASSASSLTAETSMMASVAPAGQVNMTSSNAPMSQEQQQQQDHLIVSADEQSGTNFIMGTDGGAVAEAEAKALAYENAVLRQALERMGGKPPKTYVEEANLAKLGDQSNKANEAKLMKLEKELADAKSQALLAKDATRTTLADSKLSDKISHTSFSVGDFALFMPTGFGSGGKRSYVAFHTRCPHHYLSSDCVKGSPNFILGRIVYKEELVAGESGTDANPYGLPVDTKFWVLTVEVVQPKP